MRQCAGHLGDRNDTFAWRESSVDGVSKVDLRVGECSALRHITELCIAKPFDWDLAYFFGRMADAFMVKRIHQNAPCGMTNRGHHIERIVQRFDFGDAHVFQAGAHACGARAFAKIGIKPFGPFSIGL